MKRWSSTFAELFGRAPQRIDKVRQSEVTRALHAGKHNNPERVAAIQAELKEKHAANPQKQPWRRRRWIVLIAINLLFVLSYQLDIQLLEGSLSASRFFGFHLIDLHSALQITLAFKHVVINLVIGTVTVLILWLLFGGRAFCSWVCPYHLLSEWGESLHLWLVEKKLVKEHAFHRGVRSVFYLSFAVMALASGYTVYEMISPTGILSRAIIYGPTLALGWVGVLLVFEIAWSRRAWCRYVCPIGMTYGFVGALSPLRVKYHLESCLHEGECRKVCLVPHVLDTVIKGRAPNVEVPLGPDCTRCGMCVDTCPTGSLRFDVKGLSSLMASENNND